MEKAKLSDLKIGKEIIIQIDNNVKSIIKIRGRLTASELKKHNITWQPIEETEIEYQNYKSVIKYYVKMGYAYIE